jgi:hypothetical protein
LREANASKDRGQDIIVLLAIDRCILLSQKNEIRLLLA